ncbi:antirestriction protein, partial [Escherichia coli]|uniref:antirestriction protein n=1 Tax=Escherichia coli TaxID=562 RepID=UPI0029C3AABB
MTQSVLLPPGPFTRRQAQAVTTTYSQTQHDLAPANQPEFELTVTPVPDEQRIDFWPQYFGAIPQRLLLEPHIFAWMDRFCEGYSGGIWSFYTLSNGGAFMSPE